MEGILSMQDLSEKFIFTEIKKSPASMETLTYSRVHETTPLAQHYGG
jgi:hypothetical protein